MGFAPLERMPTSTKVLVADIPEMDEKLRECLPGQELTFVRTMVEALKALRHDGFQLVVIGLYFDESRMLELLQYVRSLPAYKEVPLICVHGGDHLNLSDAVMKNIDVAVKALGGAAFLNLRDGSLDYTKDCSFLDRVATESGTSVRPN
jgi:PleD family two-component response regulator